MSHKAPAYPLAPLEMLKEVAGWNRADLRGIEEITPDRPMLLARAKVLRDTIKATTGERSRITRGAMLAAIQEEVAARACYSKALDAGYPLKTYARRVDKAYARLVALLKLVAKEGGA